MRTRRPSPRPRKALTQAAQIEIGDEGVQAPLRDEAKIGLTTDRATGGRPPTSAPLYVRPKVGSSIKSVLDELDGGWSDRN